MSAGHSPAPWRVSEENCGGGLNVVDANGSRVLHSAEHRSRDGTIVRSPEAFANAYLAAQAPDMLAALQGALFFVPLGTLARIRAEAAIAKALPA